MPVVKMRSKDIAGRGKGKKPALEHVNLRVPKPIVAWYKEHPNSSAVMRKALVEYVQKFTTTKKEQP